jgi:hypothetical protein
MSKPIGRDNFMIIVHRFLLTIQTLCNLFYRYCLKEGNYALSLNDTLLFDQHRKNALLVVTPSSTGVNVTLFGTSEVTLFVVADDSIPSGNGDDDDSPSTILVVLVSVGAGLILIGLFIFIW